MKVGIALLLILLLSGCATQTKPISVSTIEIEKAPLILPAIDRFRARDIEWIVVTPENYQEVVDELKASGKNIALFALTDDGYQDLGLNLGDIQTIIVQQQAIIAAYRDYYVNPPKQEEPKEKPTNKKWFQKLF